MSALAAPTLDEVLEVASQSINDAIAKTGADRREHARLTGAELEWLRDVRLKSGPSVQLIDLSQGGALIDSRVHMRPGSTITLAITAPGSSIEVSSRILRCHLSQIGGGGAAIYRGACMFTEPLLIDQIRRGDAMETVQSAALAPEAAAGLAPAAWQKIVVRYRDGATLKGFTLDFHPSREHFSLWPSVNAARRERVIVPMARLKAVFFVKDFGGDPGRLKQPAEFAEGAPGRRVEVTFLDREVIRGTTLSYRPEGSGFFILPADTSGNNQRIFVINGGVRHVRFP